MQRGLVGSEMCIRDRYMGIKVKVETLPFINQELKDIDHAIDDEKGKIKDLDNTDMDYEFDSRNSYYSQIDQNAGVRVSNIPDNMTVQEIRDIFRKYGHITRMSMPRPIPVSEDQIRAQRRAQKRQKKRDKKMEAIRKPSLKEEDQKEEEKKKAQSEEVKTHRGFAFIYFEFPEQAHDAIKREHDKAYYSQIISVRKAMPRR
eukprot:TRINITY_DN5599_c0_g1_i2.p1 TRINITY_DN5599_c0_g1~~TRINITY_DN5599_c0_g1_i2.p1  ORF type:complete len:202 (-),score=56.65 TRINITY_DN5599_c0_g1_i2:50-655(-)